MSCYEKWSLFITGIGVAVGIGVLIVYGLQLRAMNKSVASSESASRAAEASVKTLRNLERPWVLARMEPADMIIPDVEWLHPDSGKEKILTYIVRNYGR